jgi:purine-binding chemotaxis protein CheW
VSKKKEPKKPAAPEPQTFALPQEPAAEHEPAGAKIIALDDFFAEFDGVRQTAGQRDGGLQSQKERAASKDEEYLTFSLSRERYGMPINKVREIIKPPPLTFLPRQPTYVGGIFSLRGAIVPVIFLAQRLGLVVAAIGRPSRVIVIEDQEELVGLVVDEVFDVMRLSQAAIEPPPQWKGTTHAELIRGVGRAQEAMVILLDCDVLIANLRAA